MYLVRRKSRQTNLQSKQIVVHLSGGSLRLAGLVPNKWENIQATAYGSATADGMDTEAEVMVGGWMRAKTEEKTYTEIEVESETDTM